MEQTKKNVKLNDLKENEMMCINGGAGWLGPSIIFQIAMEILDGTFFSDIEKGYNGEW